MLAIDYTPNYFAKFSRLFAIEKMGEVVDLFEPVLNFVNEKPWFYYC